MDFILTPAHAEHNTAVRKLLIDIQVLQSNEQKRNFLKLQYKLGQDKEKHAAYTAYLELFNLHGKQQQAKAFLDSPI